MPNVLHPHGSSSRLLLGPRPTIHVLHHSPLRARSRSFAPSSTLQVSLRLSSSSSSKRWQARQSRDPLARSAKLLGLKSRAAFKLLELDAKYKLFRPGATVVDLGFAPGSWSQVAIDRTKPDGRVLGVDLIPTQPPKGVSTIQGNFLDPTVQADIKSYLRDPVRGRPRARQRMVDPDAPSSPEDELSPPLDNIVSMEELEEAEQGYIERERRDSVYEDEIADEDRPTKKDRTVDIVLSDMWAPWELVTGYWNRSLSDPYYRMMNTSGVVFKDHASSMDLCQAALEFCFETLRTGGNFVCKFYQGAEDKALETRMKQLFRKVHREKPAASRSESREGYFVALKRIADIDRNQVFHGS